MAYAFNAGETTPAVYDIVTGAAAGFIDENKSIHVQ